MYQLIKTFDLHVVTGNGASWASALQIMPGLLCDTNRLEDHVFQVQGPALVNAFKTLTHARTPSHQPPTSFEHVSSVFSQWCRIKLSAALAAHRDGLSFLGFLGPTSKSQRLKLGNSEQLESLFNHVSGNQACHQSVTPQVQTPWCCRFTLS